VGAALDLAGFQLQLWLSAIQCLDLRFFINRQHQRIVRRIQVQANDIENLLSKVWIIAYFEGFRSLSSRSIGKSSIVEKHLWAFLEPSFWAAFVQGKRRWQNSWQLNPVIPWSTSRRPRWAMKKWLGGFNDMQKTAPGTGGWQKSH
tara:strand:+ start:927 stop:1364 length:438 start_codon:yes stop_codon:yes gene_type:complete